jgi:protein phosphatase methylesterase 1
MRILEPLRPPNTWLDCFDAACDIEIDGHNFRAYVANVGPRTAGSPALLPAFVLVHGAGLSALSWGPCARILRAQGHPVIAVDLRAHGASHPLSESTLTVEAAAADVVAVFERVVGSTAGSYDDAVAGIYVVGHSFGAAVAVRIAHERLLRRVYGVVVVDAIEEHAVEALSSMERYLRERPQWFLTQDDAVEWCVRAGLPHCRNSARITVPSILMATGAAAAAAAASAAALESGADGASDRDAGFVWRTRLMETRALWPAWFDGLTRRFLECPCGRLLVVTKASVLGTQLTIAQMQGKFQHALIVDCGHHVHEDQPLRVAELLLEFARRNIPLQIPNPIRSLSRSRHTSE